MRRPKSRRRKTGKNINQQALARAQSGGSRSQASDSHRNAARSSGGSRCARQRISKGFAATTFFVVRLFATLACLVGLPLCHRRGGQVLPQAGMKQSALPPAQQEQTQMDAAVTGYGRPNSRGRNFVATPSIVSSLWQEWTKNVRARMDSQQMTLLSPKCRSTATL